MSLTPREEQELLLLLEAEERERIKNDYELFAKENIKIVDKNGNQIPFAHNNIQRQINDTVKRLRSEGKLYVLSS